MKASSFLLFAITGRWIIARPVHIRNEEGGGGGLVSIRKGSGKQGIYPESRMACQTRTNATKTLCISSSIYVASSSFECVKYTLFV